VGFYMLITFNGYIKNGLIVRNTFKIKELGSIKF
jgi:hypothetical protein